MTEPRSINIGTPWSGTELEDLKRGLRLGVSLEVIANFIKHDVNEVHQKADELGILPAWKRRPEKSEASTKS